MGFFYFLWNASNCDTYSSPLRVHVTHNARIPMRGMRDVNSWTAWKKASFFRWPFVSVHHHTLSSGVTCGVLWVPPRVRRHALWRRKLKRVLSFPLAPFGASCGKSVSFCICTSSCTSFNASLAPNFVARLKSLGERVFRSILCVDVESDINLSFLRLFFRTYTRTVLPLFFSTRHVCMFLWVCVRT